MYANIYVFFLQNSNKNSSCTGCKSGELASAFCQDCTHFLCANCTLAHQYMHCFEGHRVDQLSQEDAAALAAAFAEKTACKCIQVKLKFQDFQYRYLLVGESEKY